MSWLCQYRSFALKLPIATSKFVIKQHLVWSNNYQLQTKMWSLILLFPEAQKSKNQNQLNSHTAKDDPEWLALLHFSNTFLSA